MPKKTSQTQKTEPTSSKKVKTTYEQVTENRGYKVHQPKK